jgi:hypothetical protein
MQKISGSFSGSFSSLIPLNPLITEYKVYVNGVEIKSDEPITEVKIVPIPPYNFKANG